MKDLPEQPATAAEDRRREDRAPACAPARLQLADSELRARIENVSQGGLFAVLEDAIEFDVQVDGEPGTRRVRLVRAQPIPGGKMGLGLQFVDSSDRAGGR